MELLRKFDQLAFNVDDYVNTLDTILAQKMESIRKLRNQIAVFNQHLREEELLSASLKGGALSLIPGNIIFYFYFLFLFFIFIFIFIYLF